MFNFNPLWKQLIDKNMTKTELRQQANFTSPVLAKMSKNEYISIDVLDRICNTLHCRIEDVIEHIES